MTSEKLTPHQRIIKRWKSLQAMATAITEARGELISKATVQGWWTSGIIPSKHHSAVFFAGQALDPKIVQGDFFDEEEIAAMEAASATA